MKNVRLTLFVSTVTLLGMAIAGAAAIGWDHEDVGFLAAACALAAVAEAADFSPFRNSRVSISIALIFAAGVFSGLPGAALVAVASAAADFAAHRKPATKAAFNAGTLLVSGAVFAGVIHAFDSSYDVQDWTALLGPVLLASAAAFAVNSGLVSIAIGMDKGRGWLATWNANFRWLLPHYVILGVLALFAAAAYDRWEMAGLALVLAPLAMAWLIMKQGAEGAAGTGRLAGSAS